MITTLLVSACVTGLAVLIFLVIRHETRPDTTTGKAQSTIITSTDDESSKSEEDT